MKPELFFEKLKQNPESIEFQDCINCIDANYVFNETCFTNGKIENKAGENNGSCKIFAFGLLNQLTVEQTLHCFGNYYRVDVLQHPEANNHQNIRNFIKTGWNGIKFNQQALTPR